MLLFGEIASNFLLFVKKEKIPLHQRPCVGVEGGKFLQTPTELRLSTFGLIEVG